MIPKENAFKREFAPPGDSTPPPFNPTPAPITPNDSFKRDIAPAGNPLPPSISAPTFPPATDPTPMPIPRIPARELPTAPPIFTTPPNGGTQIPTVPPVAIGGATALPSVRSTTPDVVESLPGETDFTQLSKRLYGTDKYANALLAFNRKYHGGVTNGESFLRDPPMLNQGQQVLNPPVNLLERDFGTLINNAPAANPTIPTIKNAPALNLSKPSPIAPDIAPVSGSSGPGRTYTVVAASGERLRDIAERELGDPSRWTQIYRLNPTVQPQFAVPPGTKLQLP